MLHRCQEFHCGTWIPLLGSLQLSIRNIILLRPVFVGARYSIWCIRLSHLDQGPMWENGKSAWCLEFKFGKQCKRSEQSAFPTSKTAIHTLLCSIRQSAASWSLDFSKYTTSIYKNVSTESPLKLHGKLKVHRTKVPFIIWISFSLLAAIFNKLLHTWRELLYIYWSQNHLKKKEDNVITKSQIGYFVTLLSNQINSTELFTFEEPWKNSILYYCTHQGMIQMLQLNPWRQRLLLLFMHWTDKGLRFDLLKL